MNRPGRPGQPPPASSPGLLRERAAGGQRVTTIELFFDLVYVFAVTQLSHYLLHHQTLAGAAQAAVLLAMVWQLWAYTTWVTNWLDPDTMPVRLLLLALMLVGLGMSAALPDAFTSSGVLVGSSYALMQIGRSLFAVRALRGDRLQRNFVRILCWCAVSGALAVAGGLASQGLARALLWLSAVGVDLLGGAAGFWTPGLGRTPTRDWTIEGGHFAERCQAFVLIALGESIVVTGATLADLLTGELARVPGQRAGTVAAFGVAFAGIAGLWWLYFDRSAEDGARLIARSADPGRLGRSAYHFVHPIMVAGVIAVAAADDLVLVHPGTVGIAITSWLVLAGTGLFVLGHLLFKVLVWRVLNRPRLMALVVLGILGLAAPHLTALALSACATAVVIIVAISDHIGPWRVAATAAGGSAG